MTAQQHWGINASGDAMEAAHVGYEPALADSSDPCEKPDPGDSIAGDTCDSCGSNVYRVEADGRGAKCEDCGTVWPLRLYGEDDLVWL